MLLQGSWFAGFLARAVPAARDRLIADHRFLFLVLAEITIDSGKHTELEHPASACGSCCEFAYCSGLAMCWRWQETRPLLSCVETLG